MANIEPAAHCLFYAVTGHRSQVIADPSQAGHGDGAGPGKLDAGFHVIGFCQSDGQIFDDGFHHRFFEAVVDIRIFRGGEIKFREVGQNVETAGGNLSFRQSQCQFRVNYDDSGQQVGDTDGGFFVGIFPIGNDAGDIHLRTCSGHGGDLNEEGWIFGGAHIADVIPDGFGAGAAEADALGGIHGAAAAEADDKINLFFAG